jgi:hypothetical protein
VRGCWCTSDRRTVCSSQRLNVGHGWPNDSGEYETDGLWTAGWGGSSTIHHRSARLPGAGDSRASLVGCRHRGEEQRRCDQARGNADAVGCVSDPAGRAAQHDAAHHGTRRDDGAASRLARCAGLLPRVRLVRPRSRRDRGAHGEAGRDAGRHRLGRRARRSRRDRSCERQRWHRARPVGASIVEKRFTLADKVQLCPVEMSSVVRDIEQAWATLGCDRAWTVN